MTPEMIQQLREQIAAEIAEKFGNLAPYTLVQTFVRTGPQMLCRFRRYFFCAY
jgi:hypothetical protein